MFKTEWDRPYDMAKEKNDGQIRGKVVIDWIFLQTMWLT